MNNFQSTTLGEVAECISGFPFSSSDFLSVGKGNFRVVRGDNLNEGFFEWGKKERRWLSISPQLESFLLQEGDILVGMDGSKVGKNWSVIQKKDLPALLGQRVCCIRAKDNFEQDFLAKFFGSKEFYRYVEIVKTGTSIPHISKNQIEQFVIRTPPLLEQKKIAEILSKIDKLIVNIKKQISKLQDLQRGVMCDLLTRGIGHSKFKKCDFGRIPNTWDIGPLSEIADMISGFAFSSSDFVENGSLCIRMGNLYNNQFDQSRSPSYLPKDFIKEYPKFIVNSGDLLMSMTGTAGKRDYGFVVEVPDGFEQGLLNQRVAKILSKNSNSKKFICELMRSDFYLEKLFAFGSGTKQANLSVKQILGIVIPIPPIDEQVQIGEIISSIERHVYEKQQRFLHLQILKDSLMQDLLSGNRRVGI